MMRTLMLLALLAAPLLAQEQGKDEKEPAAAPAEDAAQKAKADRIIEAILGFETDEGAKLNAELKGLSRQELEEVLKALERRGDINGHFIFESGEPQELNGIFVRSDGTAVCETITGQKDGTSYTLKSLGEGRFHLEATQKDERGGETKTTDDGTLAELQKKYAFLEGAVGVGWPSFFDTAFLSDTGHGLGGSARWTGAEAAGTLGVLVHPASEELRYHLALPTGAGLIVEKVLPDSRAEKLGLKQFDVLLRFDGELIDSPQQAGRIARAAGKLEIVRRGKPMTIDAPAPETKRVTFTK